MRCVGRRAALAARLLAVCVPGIAAVGMALPGRVLAQETTVAGRVTSENGAPVSLASVYLSALGLGGQTGPDGRYTFTVPGARAGGRTTRLAVRAIGYTPDSVQVTLSPGTVTQDFVVKANPLQLGQIVVTGAGTYARTEALGTAQHAVGDSLIVKSAEPNAVEALAGKAPNVEVTNSEGAPGAGSYIRIRGIRTLSGSGQPLFVVDGVAINNNSVSTESLNPADAPLTTIGPSANTEGASTENRLIDLNPNDIDDVQILSGGASAAIYGARGGQGVVLITTKHGKAGGTHFSLSSNESLDQLSNMYQLQTLYGQGDVGITVDPTVCNAGGNSSGACFRSWGGLLPKGTPVFDHANEAFRLGWTVNNTLSASGGNDRTTYYASGSFLSQNGVFIGPSNYFDRYSFRLNAAHQISNAFKVSGNATFAYSDGNFQQRGNNTNGLLLGLLRSPPEFNNYPYIVNGQQRGFLLQNPGPSDVLTNRQFDNPFFALHENKNSSQVGRFFGNSDVSWLPLGWLTFDYVLGGDYSTDQRYEGIPIGSATPASGGRVVDGRFTNFQIEQSITGSARYNLSSALNGVLTAGWDLNSVHQNISGAVGRNLVATSPLLLSNASQIDQPVIDADTVLNDQSFFGQASINLADQIFLVAAIRRDGSSAFDSAHRYSWFPKGTAAWTFTKDLPQNGFLTFGKLRAAYGQSGQVPQAYLVGTTFSPGLFPISTQGTGFTQVGYNGSSGLASNIFKAASELREERTTEGEFGIDLGLINDHVDLGATYYNSRTDGVILAVPTAPSTGYQQTYANGAKFQNTGGELTLNIRPLTYRNFAWDVGLQGGINRSKDVNLAGCNSAGCNYSLQGGLIENAAIPGQPIGVFYDFGWARCGVTSAASVGDPAFATACAGKAKGTLYLDATGFPVNDLNQRIIGDPNPKWTGSIRSGVRIFNIRLSALVDIRHGGTINNGTESSLINYGTLASTVPRATCTTRATSGCTGNLQSFGTPGFYPGPVAGPGAGMKVPIGENWFRSAALGPACAYTGVNEPCMEDGGFTKLREVSIAYTFQGFFLRKIGFSTVDVRFYGRNLATITNYTGLDPESNLDQISLVRGQDYYQLPQNRSYGVSFVLNR